MNLSVPAELSADNWRRAGRELLAKTLGELAYEQLLEPVAVGDGRYRVDFAGDVSYAFTAKRGSFLDFRVEPTTIVRTVADTQELAEDPLTFFLDARESLGMSGDTCGHLTRELTATLAADAKLLDSDAATVEKLAEMSYAELEGHQTGHPWLIPNKGRMGFSASDAAEHAPEARRSRRLPWIAVHRVLADYRAVDGLTEDGLLGGELDRADRDRFRQMLVEQGLDPADYVWMPVHPWQWDEVVLPVFTPDVVARRIVPLGEGTDAYFPQQSIRTFANVDNHHRHYVKLPLSILNTLVWRGLPTERTVAAPAVTAWVLGIAESDPFLRDETRAVLLGEVASVTVRHSVLEQITDVP